MLSLKVLVKLIANMLAYNKGRNVVAPRELFNTIKAAIVSKMSKEN